jgi:hypothetical protein
MHKGNFVLKFPYTILWVLKWSHTLVAVEMLCPSCAQMTTAAAHTLIHLTEVSSPHRSVPAPCLGPANRVIMLSAHIYWPIWLPYLCKIQLSKFHCLFKHKLLQIYMVSYGTRLFLVSTTVRISEQKQCVSIPSCSWPCGITALKACIKPHIPLQLPWSDT